MRALSVGLALAALVLAPAAAGAEGGLRTTLTGVDPAVDGLEVAIVDSDGRMRVTNDTGETVVVLGYAQEPYLKFEDGTVFVNTNSGSYYLNKDRYGETEPPAGLDLAAAPAWEPVADGNAYDWHDHRIHWMGTTDPGVVRDDRGSEHHILDWTVPIEVDGRAVEASGRLDYVPPDDSRSVWLYGGVGVVVVGAFGSAMFVRRRRLGS